MSDKPKVVEMPPVDWESLSDEEAAKLQFQMAEKAVSQGLGQGWLGEGRYGESLTQHEAMAVAALSQLDIQTDFALSEKVAEKMGGMHNLTRSISNLLAVIDTLHRTSDSSSAPTSTTLQ